MKTALKSKKPNEIWHNANRMPPNAKFADRVAWHLEHQRHCSCRPIPAKLAAQMKEKGIKF